MDQNNKVFLTSEGLAHLKKEYESIMQVRRPATVERLSNARNAGDLSENSDYTQAKEDLAFIDGRIAELEEVLGRVQMIDEGHKNCGEVNLGCKVKVSVNGNEYLFHIVGEWEADPELKKISHESPLGKMLIGRKTGDKVEVEAPAGKITYTVVSID